MDSPDHSLAKSDALLNDIVEKLLLLCLCKFRGFYLNNDMVNIVS